MSGGAFDYYQHHILEIVDEMRRAVNGGRLDNYQREVRDKFHEGIAALLVAYTHAQLADWLLSGDDGPESYLERLADDIAELATRAGDGVAEDAT